MNCVWKQVFLCGVILNSVFSAEFLVDPKLRLYECVPLYCKDKCETLDDCFGSTEFSQLYYKNFLDPGSPAYSPKNICEKSNPVKIWCKGKSERIIQGDAICGQVISDDITIGPKTKINEFPWMALLQYTDGKTIETSCQGVLITNQYVVTSATCLNRNTNGFNLTSVRLGEWDRTSVIDCDNSSGVSICNDPPVVVPIAKTVISNYFVNMTGHDFNTGLIHLEHKVEFTDFIKPICVPHFVWFRFRREFYVGRKFEIAGWGETTPTGKKSEVLLKVDFEAVACPGDSDSWLCIQSTRKRNVCAGDEGSPIMGRTTLGNRTYVYLAGIVSHSNTCKGNEGSIFLGVGINWDI